MISTGLVLVQASRLDLMFVSVSLTNIRLCITNPCFASETLAVFKDQAQRLEVIFLDFFKPIGSFIKQPKTY